MNETSAREPNTHVHNAMIRLYVIRLRYEIEISLYFIILYAVQSCNSVEHVANSLHN